MHEKKKKRIRKKTALEKGWKSWRCVLSTCFLEDASLVQHSSEEQQVISGFTLE